jgi:NADH dehydrogenase (ubiquinone) 1 beta subcomplex subunit 8
MATAFRALRLAQRAPIARQMPVSRIASALPRTYATATVREATPDKPVEQAEQASEDLSDPNMNGNYPDPSKTSALPLKRQFRDPRGEWWDPQERRNYGEPVHEVRTTLKRYCGAAMADETGRTTIFSASSPQSLTPTSPPVGVSCSL